MSCKLTFGKYEGKAFEWLFFNKPDYARWIIDNRIHRQQHNFDEQEGNYFKELYHRASHLGGICCQCKERAVTRMGLTTTFKHGDLAAVGFYCDKCEYQGGSCTSYYEPSFFVDAYDLEPWEQKMVTNEIMRHYIGSGNVTPKRMEIFFRDDEYFTDAAVGLFSVIEATG